MGKRCACERLFDRLRSDTRLATLPMAAQMLWLQLMRLAAETQDGVLHLGFRLGFLTALSKAVSQSETEVEAALAALEEIGAAVRGEDGRSLLMPEAAAASERRKAAQINGLRGGRPRKGESTEAYRERRQGSLALPIAGGLAETQETERKPSGESSRAAAAIEAKRDSAAAANAGEAWVSLGAELAEIARLDPHRPWSYHDVKGWLDEGATPEMIRGEVERIAARPGYEPPGVGLRYFAKPIRKLIEQGRAERGSPDVQARIAANTLRINAMLAGTAYGPASGAAA